MIVSILQLMGFPMGKPVHSRASDHPDSAPAKGDKRGITASDADHKRRPSGSTGSPVHAQAHSARRQEVKTQPVKAKPAPKATKVVAKGKPAPKAKAAPVAKTKTQVTPAKSTVKPAKSAKPAKPAKAVAEKAKPHAKTAPAKASKPAKPTSVKPAKPVKAAAAKPGKVTSTKTAKPSAKVAPSKPGAKVAAQVRAKVDLKKASSPVKAPAAVAKSRDAATAPATLAPVSSAVASPGRSLPVAPATPALAPKAGRPSSRLAQLTVPSMAQSVASTAAKASYIQTMSDPLIAPPVASAAKKDPKLANNWKTKPLEQLTDADLLAMPDAEYMNATQLAVFRLKLSVLKQDILSMAGETTEHLREDTVVVPDPADRATIEEEHALELRTRDRERKLLKKIEQSIARIDAGDYGYCDETGEPIGVGRLLARPTATLSLEAQQRRELKQKMFGD